MMFRRGENSWCGCQWEMRVIHNRIMNNLSVITDGKGECMWLLSVQWGSKRFFPTLSVLSVMWEARSSLRMRMKSCSEREGEGDGIKIGCTDGGNKIDSQPTVKDYLKFMVMKLGQVIMVVCFSLTLFRYMHEDIE